jgi:hypothetical protein
LTAEKMQSVYVENSWIVELGETNVARTCQRRGLEEYEISRGRGDFHSAIRPRKDFRAQKKEATERGREREGEGGKSRWELERE